MDKLNAKMDFQVKETTSKDYEEDSRAHNLEVAFNTISDNDMDK